MKDTVTSETLPRTSPPVAAERGTCPSAYSRSLYVGWDFASSFILARRKPAAHSYSQREEAGECSPMLSPDAISICVVSPSSNALGLDPQLCSVRGDGSSDGNPSSASWTRMRDDKGQPVSCETPRSAGEDTALAGACSWVLSDALVEEAEASSDGERQEGKGSSRRENPQDIWGCTPKARCGQGRRGTTQTPRRAQGRGAGSRHTAGGRDGDRASTLLWLDDPCWPRRPTAVPSPSQHPQPPSNTGPMEDTPRADIGRRPKPPSKSHFFFFFFFFPCIAHTPRTSQTHGEMPGQLSKGSAPTDRSSGQI